MFYCLDAGMSSVITTAQDLALLSRLSEVSLKALSDGVVNEWVQQSNNGSVHWSNKWMNWVILWTQAMFRFFAFRLSMLQWKVFFMSAFCNLLSEWLVPYVFVLVVILDVRCVWEWDATMKFCISESLVQEEFLGCAYLYFKGFLACVWLPIRSTVAVVNNGHLDVDVVI